MSQKFLCFPAVVTSCLSLMTVAAVPCPAVAQDDETKRLIAEYRAAAAAETGEAMRGKAVFTSKEAACTKCHVVSSHEDKAGPDLRTIGDKYTRDQLIREVLEPSSHIHPDYGTTSIITVDGKVISGVLRKRTDGDVQLIDAEGRLVRVPVTDIDEEKKTSVSLMPTVFKTVKKDQFVDLLAYLTTLKQQDDGSAAWPGMPPEIPLIETPIRLEPYLTDGQRFDHPVWMIALPESTNEYLVIEQMTRKIWLLAETDNGVSRTLFADLANESITGRFEGVMCLDFHPEFVTNGKYYVNHHVREDGRFAPVIVERQTDETRRRDRGGPSRRLIKVHQDTDLHWGGMLAFGPDGYLYIGCGDGGPQEDPDGHGQDLSILLGKVLRIDVDSRSGDLPYGIPPSNPFADGPDENRPEIWAWGFRMPWRFMFHPETKDLWVGDIGQNLFEEVTIARIGENHGWNVYEGFNEFSNRYRRQGETFTPPLVAYRRRHGVSVTGGFIYQGSRSPSFRGTYVFGDFESRRIWALTQTNRKLNKVRQIGSSPDKFASFGLASNGELFLLGYEQGMIYRVVLDDSTFE